MAWVQKCFASTFRLQSAPAAVSAWDLRKAFGFSLMAGMKAKVAKKSEVVDPFQLEEDLVTWSSQC